MNLQHLFAMSAMGLGAESMYYIAIGVLACVLGAEIAGICILIRKMSTARREADLHENEENAERYHSGNAAFFLLGAVPIAAQISLLILSIAAAVTALVFVILLIVFRAKGYSLVAPSALRVSQTPVEVETVTTEETVAEDEDTTLSVFGEDTVDEEQQQEGYTEAFALSEELPEVDEEGAEEVPLIIEPVSEEASEENAEAAPEAVNATATGEPLETPVAAVLQRPAAYAGFPGNIPVYRPAYSDGQPVIEKHITETVREVIKETNTTTTVDGGNTQLTEELLKAIVEFMKLSTQKRMEQELAVENSVTKNEESVPTLSNAVANEHTADDVEDVEDVDDADDAEMDDDDDNDIELDEAEGAVGEDDTLDTDEEYESEYFTGNERIIGIDEETGWYIVAHYRKSFEAKLIQASLPIKKYYSEIKNALLSYEDTKDRISWNGNTYTNNRTPVAKINIGPKKLDLYLALDPSSLEDSVYHGRDVSDKKKYADTPFLFRVKSPRRLTLALELVRRTCEEMGLSPIDIEPVSYEKLYPIESNEDLIRRGLIREYVREEKPAATFELDPDHSPELPEEDGSVIPANANFTWEIDEEAEHEVEPESTPEPEASSDPQSVEQDQINIDDALADVLSHIGNSRSTTPVTTTTTHETVKTIERQYTEHTYSSAGTSVTYTETALPEQKQPVAVIAETGVAEELPVATVAPEEVYETSIEDAFEDVIEVDTGAAAEDELEETDGESEIIEEDEIEEAEEETEIIEEDEIEETEEESEIIEEDEPEVYEEEDEANEYEEVYEDDSVVYEEDLEESEELDPEEAEGIEEITAEAAEPAPYTPPTSASDPTVAVLDACIFDDYFENGAIVNLETLKQMDLVPATAQRLKVNATGDIKGKFTVEAHHFTLQAIKAIGDADGDSIMIR